MQYNIRSLQVFECVFRHASLAGAAKELGITSSAISHQLRGLREQIGEDLFVKRGRSIAFTDHGKRIAESLKYAFSEIDASVRNGITGSDRFLRVMMCSCFGLGWFIPRLTLSAPENWRNHLQLKMHAEEIEISDSVADIFFSTTPLKSGYWSSKVVDEILIAVARENCGSQKLITHEVDQATFGDDWASFSAMSGDTSSAVLDRSDVIGSSHYIFALEMAVAGVGTALVPNFLAEQALKDGKLVLASPHGMPSGRAYYINVKHARRHEPIINEFCSWVLKTARK